MIMRVSPAATQDIEIMHSQEQCLVLQVVPPRTASSRDIAALETVMQGLVLDTHHPVALEIARTESGRQFLPTRIENRRNLLGGRATARGGLLPAVAFLARARTPQRRHRSAVRPTRGIESCAGEHACRDATGAAPTPTYLVTGGSSQSSRASVGT